MQQGYYSERIKSLEERKEEVTAQLVTSKLTLKGIDKEIEACYEYMNSAHYDANTDMSGFEKQISDLEHQINVKETTIKKMNNTINQKNGKIKSLNKVIEDKDHEISVLKLEHSIEEKKLEERISELHIKLNHKFNVKEEEYTIENRQLEKQNREFKRDIKGLNERIKMMDKTIEKKNREIQILHERLRWQPKKTQSNIFEEIRQEGK